MIYNFLLFLCGVIIIPTFGFGYGGWNGSSGILIMKIGIMKTSCNEKHRLIKDGEFVLERLSV